MRGRSSGRPRGLSCIRFSRRCQLIPFCRSRTGGRGPALNVVAEVEYHDQSGKRDGHWEFGFGVVAAGDIEMAGLGPSVAPPWHGVSGVLRYGDLAGGEYETPFRFSRSRHDLQLTVGEQRHITPVELRESPDPRI